MIEFETICFLQNHKTGSTFMEQFLKANIAETLTPHKAHAVPMEKREGVFYFVCVRDPLDLYLSLFNFGLDGEGQIKKRLGMHGLSDFYDDGIDGFDRWLRFILSPDFAPIVPKYTPHVDKFGFCAWRYLRLARFNLRRPDPAMDHVMLYENFDQELAALMDGPLRHAIRDRAAADLWITARRGVNASNRRDRSADIWLSGQTIRAALSREAVLYDAFYPQTRDRLRDAGGGDVRINDLIGLGG